MNEICAKEKERIAHLSFLPFFSLQTISFSTVSSSTLVFLANVLSATDNMARLRADEVVETGGDGWGRSPLCVVDFEARVEGISWFLSWMFVVTCKR